MALVESKSFYIPMPDYRHLAVLDMSANTSPSEWRIARINVPSRYQREGVGTKLMKMAIEYADEHHLSLSLEPMPYGLGMPYDELVKWYESFGFEWGKSARDDILHMVRPA